MPLYDYACVDCSATDQRLGGLDDHLAICVVCGGLMERLDDPFETLEPTFPDLKPEAGQC